MRYFLHLRDGQDIALDQEGLEFDSVETLRDGMLNAARDVMAGDVLKGCLDLTLRIDAETGSGQVVESLPFQRAIAIKSTREAA